MLNNTPLAAQRISDSQPLINQNFTVINTAFSVNHVQYNDPSGNQGKHNCVVFPTGATVPTFLANECGFYLAQPTNTGTLPTYALNEIFINKLIVGGAAQTVPMTGSILSTTVAVTNPTGLAGWTYLPSGLLLKWGLTPAIPSAATPPSYLNFTIPSSANNPAFANLFHVQLTAAGTPANGVGYQIVNANLIQCYSQLGVSGAYYFAIGV